MISKLAFAVVALAAAGAPSTERMPKPGSYGFNWLQPASAACRKLSEKDLAKASKCSLSKNAFGLELDSYACKVSARVELIVYATAAQCQQGLETMQANGD